jgi:hypothetical protein
MPIRTPRWLSVAIAYGFVAHACSDSDDGQDVKVNKDASVDAPSGGKGGTAGSGGSAGKGGSAGTSDLRDDGIERDESSVSCVGADVDVTPPTIVSAALIGGDEVRITFSEPVRPPADVEPLKFRLSIAYSYNAEGPIYTEYEDLNQNVIDGDTQFSQLLGACTSEVSAIPETSIPINGLCRRLSELADGSNNQKVGLYLHFRQAGTPTIQDRSGNPLADVSEEWATPVDGSLLNTKRDTTEFPGNPIQVSVSCPSDAGTD